jgi:hypothetical protein
LGNSCVKESCSTIVGCFGIAPISVRRWTSATALAPLAALVLGAGATGDGAAEVVGLLGGEDSGREEGASGVSVGCGVIGANPGIAVAGAVGITGADVTGETGLMGLIGDSTLVGFVIDFTQLSDVVCQTPDHTGLPYGFGQVLVIDWVMLPVNPA